MEETGFDVIDAIVVTVVTGLGIRRQGQVVGVGVGRESADSKQTGSH
jgi:hypothetical protein